MLTRTWSVATSDDGSHVTRDGNGQPQTEFLESSTLDKPSSLRHETNARAPLAKTPPASQLTESTSSGQGLSRQSTEPAIDNPSSSSSFSSSFSSVSSGNGDIGDQKLSRILVAVRGMVDECRICWVNRETRRPHRTFKCTTGICAGYNWDKYKVGLQFPKNIACYFCLSPFGPPFNHAGASPGTRPSADLCEYPDVLKELVYILYQNEALRTKIFAKLGVARPSSLTLYQRFIGKRQHDGILGAYEVVNAYLELRESGEGGC